jgi:peptide/nickel transport system substrate-binding protein
VIRDDWAVLGVGVTLQAVPYDELISDYLDTRLYQSALVDLSLARTPDPDPYPFWHQTQATGGQNYSLWNDRQASEYLEQARIIADPEERGRLYRNFQVRFASELPALPLFYPMYTYAVDAEIQGVRVGPLFDFSDRFANVTEWYLFAERKVGDEAEPTETISP